MRKNIYLDYAAATPMDAGVLAAMTTYFSKDFYNPSATYLAGRQAKKELEDARRQAAAAIGAKPAEFIFTAGATEANNLAIQGIMRQFPKGEMLVSAIEHESVLKPARLFKQHEISVTPKGLVNLSELEKMISPKTVLVSIMLVNNELGTVQPLREIAEILNKSSISRRQRGNKLPLYLHSDVAQAGNYLDLHTGRLGVDLMSINGGKIYGPKQAGGLYVKTRTKLRPMIVGGGQEFGLRSGTENLAAAAGLAEALRMAQKRRGAESKRTAELLARFEQLLREKNPEAVINGSPKHRAPHISSVTFPGFDNERLMMQLDEAGIQCAVGSACSAANQEPSHVLKAVGLSDELARATLRFSFGRFTTQSEVDKTAAELARLTVSNR